MARKFTERYVRYYTHGSAAAKLQEKQTALPRYKAPQKRRPIAFDPVAVAGNAVAILLAVLMVVGFIQVANTTAQVHNLQTRVTTLELEKQMLQERYESGYDLEEVRIAAQSMGMIAAEEAVHVQVQVPQKQEEVRLMNWWDALLLSLRQFFA